MASFILSELLNLCLQIVKLRVPLRFWSTAVSSHLPSSHPSSPALQSNGKFIACSWKRPPFLAPSLVFRSLVLCLCLSPSPLGVPFCHLNPEAALRPPPPEAFLRCKRLAPAHSVLWRSVATVPITERETGACDRDL